MPVTDEPGVELTLESLEATRDELAREREALDRGWRDLEAERQRAPASNEMTDTAAQAEESPMLELDRVRAERDEAILKLLGAEQEIAAHVCTPAAEGVSER